MTVVFAYCDVPGCEDPKDPGFARPAFRGGKCSSHMKQLQRTGRTTAIKEKLPVAERLVEAYSRVAEAADGDDATYERYRREFRALAKAYGKEEAGEAIKMALGRARAAGKRIGRPPKVDSDELVRVFEILKSVSQTARVLGLSKSAVSERLATVRKWKVSERKRSPRPRLAG